MHRRALVSLAAALAFGLGSTILTNVAQADDFWDMMDPSWWFGDDDDDDWEYWAYGPGRYYAGGPYDWGGPYGGGGYYGYPYGAAQQAQSTTEMAPPPPVPE